MQLSPQRLLWLAGVGWLFVTLLRTVSPAAEPGVELVPFVRGETNGIPFVPRKSSDLPAVFSAVVDREWHPGLLPVFAVEKSGGWELRRRPGTGQENFLEPLFFGLPPEHEPEAAEVSGRWEVSATRADGSVLRLALELAAEGEAVSGRFDQNTDYRFAQLTGGSVRTNRLELAVKYINDDYRLIAQRRGDRWAGRWQRADDSEGGALELFRGLPPAALPAHGRLVALHEYRRQGSGARLYLLAGEPVPAGWIAEPRPLVRVWRTSAP
jgi:hypothetical protein